MATKKKDKKEKRLGEPSAIQKKELAGMFLHILSAARRWYGEHNLEGVRGEAFEQLRVDLSEADQRLLRRIGKAAEQHIAEVGKKQTHLAIRACVDSVTNYLKGAKEYAETAGWEVIRKELAVELLEVFTVVLWHHAPEFGEITKNLDQEKIEEVLNKIYCGKHKAAEPEEGEEFTEEEKSDYLYMPLCDEVYDILRGPSEVAYQIVGQLTGVNLRQSRNLVADQTFQPSEVPEGPNDPQDVDAAILFITNLLKSLQ
jgi:hypothetical protein